MDSTVGKGKISPRAATTVITVSNQRPTYPTAFYWFSARLTVNLQKGRKHLTSTNTNKHSLTHREAMNRYLHSAMRRNGSILSLLLLFIFWLYFLEHFGMA